jgi:poly(A) polymerase
LAENYGHARADQTSKFDNHPQMLERFGANSRLPPLAHEETQVCVLKDYLISGGEIVEYRYTTPRQMNVTKKPQLHQDWIDPHAFGIVKALQKSGYVTYLVGGCVRDLLLNIMPKDYDIATTALPDEVRKIIYRSYVIGKRFRLVLVKREGQQFEVATFRREQKEEEMADVIPEEDLNGEDTSEEAIDASPAPVPFGDNVFGTPEEDARRRDFTINGMFYDPVANQLIDYAEGLPDLEKRVIRMIGDPNKRLLEDPIRIMRGLRLKHMINFSLDPELREAMQTHASSLTMAVLPRKREEILKWLRLPDPSAPFLEAYDLGILGSVSPTLAKILDRKEQTDEFVRLLRDTHDHIQDKSNALEMFGSLVHAFVRTFLMPEPHEALKNKDLMEHPVLIPWMRDELGMFKFEQTLVLKALHTQALLIRRKEFQRRGERRQAALMRNPSFPLSLQWCERDCALSGEDLHFWKSHFEQLQREEPRRLGSERSGSRRRRRPRRRPRGPRPASATTTQRAED